MGAAYRVLVFILVVSTFLSAYETRAQPTDEIVVSSDLELLSLGEVSGGGHITWQLTGDQASVLRAKVFRMYDERTSWPRGFAFECQVTGATSMTVNNGILESIEATTFLAQLENELEGVLRPEPGTDFRFVRVLRADRAEQDARAELSTSGLVGTSLNTTANIEIRFIFNAGTRSPGRDFKQLNETLAQAVHRVFAFDAFDDPSMQGCPSLWYPFPAWDGWRRVNPLPNSTFPPGAFLWHGNAGATPWIDLGAYPPTASNATDFSEGGVTATRVDLRFATAANLSFDHTGSAAPGDQLLVQVSTDQTNWTNVRATGDVDDAVDNLQTTILGSSVFDLAPWIGQRIYLRVLFEANGDATTAGPGYFLRNIRVQAPSQAEGQIDHRHIDVVVGFLSFSDFRSPDVGAHLIRTPIGEVMFYNARFPAGSAPQDTARFATFDFVENPQILFVLLAVTSWLVGLLQGKFFERFRLAHASSLRADVRKTKWLHWTGKIVVLLLTLFYFFPTLLGAGLFVGGLTYWILSLGSVAGLGAFTFFWYDRKAKLVPPEPVIGTGERLSTDLPPPPPPASEEVSPRLICAFCDHDVEDPADAYKCLCGQVYHRAHAAEIGTCRNCGRTLEVARPKEKAMVTVKCPWCSEIQVLEDGTDFRVTKCANCGIVLEEIPQKFNYLVITEEPHIAFEWFKAVVKKGAPGLAMSTTFPEKLRREYGLPDGVELYWVSDTNPGPRTLDPKRLDFEIMRALSNFVKQNKGGVIVLDGLEYLIVENSFDRVLRFIKKVNDLASVHDATMFVPATPTGLGPEEMTLLRKEFDKVETVAATR